jgi:hypothetical protein
VVSIYDDGGRIPGRGHSLASLYHAVIISFREMSTGPNFAITRGYALAHAGARLRMH